MSDTTVGLINEIEKVFTYHKPPDKQTCDAYVEIRDKAKELALLVDKHSMFSRELSKSISCLRECVMWANAGIAVHGLDKGDLR